MKGEWAKILISVSMLQLTRWQVQMLSVLNRYNTSPVKVWCGMRVTRVFNKSMAFSLIITEFGLNVVEQQER